MNKSRAFVLKSWLLGGAAFSTLLAASFYTSPSFAENPAAGKASSMEEIVVTAQKREERLKDVPISIIALSSDELEKRQITGVDDLVKAVPGIAISSNGSLSRRIILRGVGNAFGSSSLVGVYLDDAAVYSAASQQLDLRTYDLERVEVLRGPQGTLYGEGSIGGTIRFITKNPELNHFGLTADVASMFTEDGAPSQRIESMVNVPLINDQLGVRVVGTFDHEGGWMDQPAAGQKNFNSQNLADVRIKTLWQPSDNFTANAMAIIHRNSEAPNIGEDSQGNFSQSFNLQTTPSGEDDYDLGNLTLAYDFGGARILSTTTYIDQERVARDVGQRFELSPPPSPLFDVYDTAQENKSDSVSEELRLTSTGTGPWQWTLGGFYLRAQDKVILPKSYFDIAGPPGTPLPGSYSVFNDNLSKSWAVFGDTNYRLTDRLTVGAGLREFHDDRSDLAGGQSGSFHSLDPRFYVQYKLTDQVNTYASAAKGFRSGGFNNAGQPSYGPENIWTYELGTKMDLADGRLSTNAAIFYSKYTNYQIIGIVFNPPMNITSNAGDATIKGIEADIAWHISDDWTLGFNGNYVHSELTKVNAASPSHIVGDPLDLVPNYAFDASLQRDFQWDGKAGYVRADYNEIGHEYYRLRELGPQYFSKSDIIHMLDFSVGLQWTENLSLQVFAQNILNDRGYTDPFAVEASAARERPRTFGVKFGVKFD